MTRSSTKELITPFENPKRVFRSKRRLFETPGLVESSSPELDLFSDIEEYSEEETIEIMTETMEQYMSKTRGNYGSGVVRPKINDKTHFELKGQYLNENRKNTFSDSKYEDANEHIEKSLRSLTYFIFPRSLTLKVLQEKGIGSLPGSTEPNTRDHVKLISTTKNDSSEIRRMGCSPYDVSGSQHISIFSEIVPFLRRLQNYYCDDWRKAQDVKILEAYDHTLSQKEKDPRSFTLPCFIHNVCFDKAHVDIGASVSVIPFSTYTNLGLGILSHIRLTIELTDTIIKQPRGIAENVLVKISKFIFPIDFIILDIPKDDDVSLILGRPFLSTAHSKIDVYKRKFTLRLIREDDESFDPIYGNYIELNDLDTPLDPATNQDVNFKPTFVDEPDNVKTSFEYCYKMKFSCMIGYKNVNADFIPSLSVNLITKSFYYSIIKYKDDHEGKSPAGALIDILVFVENISILTSFIIIDDEDVTRDVVLGMPFFMEYVSCQMIMKKFAHKDKCERIMDK
ncbi:ribonuclease H-like domain-containing protein [Tanacetum coccineum]